MQCWLCIFENEGPKKVYIGIGDSLERIFGKHNASADALREEPTTMILQTVEPLSSWTYGKRKRPLSTWRRWDCHLIVRRADGPAYPELHSASGDRVADSLSSGLADPLHLSPA